MADAPLLSEPLTTADEAAKLLHVPRSTLYELVRSRGLPHAKGRTGAAIHASGSRWLDHPEQLRQGLRRQFAAQAASAEAGDAVEAERSAVEEATWWFRE